MSRTPARVTVYAHNVYYVKLHILVELGLLAEPPFSKSPREWPETI